MRNVGLTILAVETSILPLQGAILWATIPRRALLYAIDNKVFSLKATHYYLNAQRVYPTIYDGSLMAFVSSISKCIFFTFKNDP